MENVQTMSDLMQQIQQRIDSLKASAMQQQTEMKQSLNECIEQSEAIQNQLVQSQQQLTSQLEYGISRSMRRPGVPTTMSAPRWRASIWGSKATPP